MSVKLIQFSDAYCLEVEDGCVHISDEEVCFAFTQEEARALCAALVECGFGPEPKQDHPTMVSDGAAGGDDKLIEETPTYVLHGALQGFADISGGTFTEDELVVIGALLRREIERRG